MKQKLLNKLWLRVGMIVAVMTTALSGTAWATDFTLSSADEVTQDGITVSFAKGSGSSAPAWYAAGLRLYASNTITISSSSTITGVTFNWEKQGTKAFASVTASTGTYSHPSSPGTGTWSGSTNSITFTLGSSGQLQLNTFSVTVSGSATPTCAAPTFSPAAGAVKSGTDVTISSSDGATIYYTTDGSTPTASSSVYTSPIEITAATTIKAIAVKDGYNNSAVAEAAYTIKQAVSGYTIDFENDVDDYVDWEFENIGTSNTAITAHGGSKYGANINDSGNGTATASIQTKEKVAYPNVFTCYVSKVSSNTTASNWVVEVSSNGSDWTEVATQDAKSMEKEKWVEFTANLSLYSNVYVRLTYSGSTAVRTVDDISITMRDPNAKITPTVTIDDTGITTTDIAGNTNVAAGTLAATVTSGETTITTPAVTWSSSDTGVATVNATTGAVTLIAVGTTTITATFAGNDDYTEASATYELTVIDSYAKGQLNNPYTVAEARAAIDAGTGTQGVYATGIVSAIPTAYSADYKNITFNFVDAEGDTDFLQAYRCGGPEAANVQVGDIVVVSGNLTKYNTTYEFGQGCILVSLTHPTITEPSIDVNSNAITATASETTGTITVTYNNITDVAAEVFFCDAEGGAATYDWLTAEIDSENNLYYMIGANTGEARTAYMKVYALDDDANDVYSELITINQAAYVAPPTPGTGDQYALYSGELVEGDYIIYYDGHAMNSTVDNGRLQYAGVTPVNNLITTDNTAIVWHIAPSGDYWTIYSADAKAYAAGTGVKNKAQMLADGTGDKALWTVSGTETYEFVNKANAAASVNANLRNNGTYGFACYAPGTGGALSLYKKVEQPYAPETITLNASGYATFASTSAVDFTNAETNGYSAWAVTAVSGTEITFSQITGAVAAGTGVLLKGTANTQVTIEYTTSGATLSDNKLEGVVAPKAIEAGQYYGLSGVKFVKVKKGIIPAGKALLPASVVEGEGTPVNAFTFNFDEDATAIKAIDNEQLTTDGVIYNVAGQRLSKMQKGINIVNGRKVLY